MDAKEAQRAWMASAAVREGARLTAFVAESNRIEGIADVREHEPDAHAAFLRLPVVTMVGLGEFVQNVVRDGTLAVLRDRPGMDVRVGPHVPIRGGHEVGVVLRELIYRINENDISAYAAHREYETLHPFMDGNGRSGRVLWLWMMQRDGELDRALRLGFLHNWYYQSLQGHRA